MSTTLTPAAFVAKWRQTTLSERAASQEHFIDLCRLLAQPTPAEHDATGTEYTFVKGIALTPGAGGNANRPIATRNAPRNANRLIGVTPEFGRVSDLPSIGGRTHFRRLKGRLNRGGKSLILFSQPASAGYIHEPPVKETFS